VKRWRPRSSFDDFADVRPQVDLDRDDGTNMALVQRRPLGVVAAITPWNSALYVTAMKIAPALAPATPLS